MEFNSYSYLLLLIPVVAVFWALPVPLRRWYVLALSVAFYASWQVNYTFLPFLICGGVYFCARRIQREPAAASRWLWTGVVFTLAILSFFKYRQFVLDNFNSLLAGLGRAPIQTMFVLALPLGISFYSFEAISYLIDMRQGRIKQARFLDLSLFVMFWPHLIAGPIVRARELLPQLSFTKKFELGMLLQGLDRLLWGLVQKNVIANNLAGFVDEGFLNRTGQGNSALDNWFLAAAFGLQIYFDFASYSNMAIGAAQLIGIKLPENFRFPYHAQNPSDFWSRWHMTLSRWIRDYLFFPVNAKFHGAPAPLYMSLIGIMALVGLWHGAGWTFILWGVLHGIYLVLYRIWETLQEERFPALKDSRLVRWAWRVFTIAAVTLAWIPFRAVTVNQALHMMAAMFSAIHLRISYSVNSYLLTLLIALVCALEPVLAGGMRRLEEAAARRRPALAAHTYLLRPLLYAAGLLMFAIFDGRDATFIYFQF